MLIASTQIIPSVISVPRLTALVEIATELNNFVGRNQIQPSTPAHRIERCRCASKAVAKIRFLRRNVEDSFFDGCSALVLVVSAKTSIPLKRKLAPLSYRQTTVHA